MRKIFGAAFSIAFLITASTSMASAPQHGLAIYGNVKYPENFKQFDYVNPDAPKGGVVKLSVIGTFDNLNPFILKGNSATGSDLVFETLMDASKDEPFSAYGLIAESAELADDRSWVKFKLRDIAKWSDGSSITADDVVFSFKTITTKGHPSYRAMYRDVKGCEKLSDREVKCTFSNTKNRELPFIVAKDLPIISKAFFSKYDFEKTTLEPVMGSGPYAIEKVDAPRSITFKRRADYWGKDLAINKGRYNFDQINFDYYRDETVAVEALKAGKYDMRLENISRIWSTAYDNDAVKKNLLLKEVFSHENPSGMQGFIMNIRRDKFKNPKTRAALNYAFDYEWANKNLFYGVYTRTRSYFSNSPFEAKGTPKGRELEILEKYKGKIPEEVFSSEYNPPKTDGTGNNRSNLLQAKKLLEEAGWVLKNGKLVDASGKPFEIELLADTPTFERVFSSFVKSLERLGITANIRIVDSSQYQKRQESFDFDMIVNVFPQSLSPGNEQLDYWTSKSADTRGSRNVIGIKDSVVDELVEEILQASSYEDLVANTSALDRVLQWGYYVIPNWHSRVYRVAYWDRFGHPATTPKYALGFTDIWWEDAEKNKAVNAFLSAR